MLGLLRVNSAILATSRLFETYLTLNASNFAKEIVRTDNLNLTDARLSILILIALHAVNKKVYEKQPMFAWSSALRLCFIFFVYTRICNRPCN